MDALRHGVCGIHGVGAAEILVRDGRGGRHGGDGEADCRGVGEKAMAHVGQRAPTR